ncbi:ExbD/TolR family protein [Roseospirillum parvum]|uniref:Biopolymer transport protein ExbD n=1 Tax=Roseospirillum parvum TaxID=83401 RepID=A0A1G8AN73_9PROT|nr:biopolymer transporter ExbD [Roseospirillum parvum]SDH22196.1 biopolymer transport protein ExbD [Roseospirillum parvum]
MIARPPAGRRGGSAPGVDEPGVLPLINVVFLLLVFFLLAGQLVAADPFAVRPPVSSAPGDGAPAVPTILLAADGRLAVLGGEEAGRDPLAGLLADGPPPLVRLKADGRVSAERVTRLLRRLEGLGVARVHLLTTPP